MKIVKNIEDRSKILELQCILKLLEDACKKQEIKKKTTTMTIIKCDWIYKILTHKPSLHSYLRHKTHIYTPLMSHYRIRLKIQPDID